MSIPNHVLEQYERKLNSLSGSGDRRRSAGKLRTKRYRCIEEYLDEDGNVIEEGKEHFTTVAPITSSTSERPPTDAPQSLGTKGKLLDSTKKPRNEYKVGVDQIKEEQLKRTKTPVVKPWKGVRVMIKKKLKMKKKKSRLPVSNEDDSGMLQRVYPTTSSPKQTSISSSTVTTSVSPSSGSSTRKGNDALDDFIMKKFFPHMHLSYGEKPSKTGKNLPSTVSPPSALPPPLERTRSSAKIPISFMELAASSNDDDHGFDRDIRRTPTKPFGRHGGISYRKRREDYDDDDDEYQDFGEYVPFYAMKMGPRARPFLDVPVRRYGTRRAFGRPMVDPSSSGLSTDRRLNMLPVKQSPRNIHRLRSLPMAPPPQMPSPLTPSPLTPPLPVPLPPPPTATQPIPSTQPSLQNDIPLEDSTPQSCSKMYRLASTFGIRDITIYARKNCRFLQMFAPGFTCEQISHFVDSCRKYNVVS
ncbi:hypothetical protein V3C99_010055 [Haemonchus contortus]